MKKLFRWIVVGQLALLITWYFTPWGFAYSGYETVLLLNGADSRFDISTLLTLSSISTACYFITYVGLLFFRAWARLALPVMSLIGFLLTPFYGLSVQSGYESMIGYLLTLGDGFLLCSVYFTNMRESFIKNSR